MVSQLASVQMKDYLLPTISSAWKMTLPMFAAPVVIREKVNKHRSLYPYTTGDIVIGCERSVRVAPPSLLPHQWSSNHADQTSSPLIDHFQYPCSITIT